MPRMVDSGNRGHMTSLPPIGFLDSEKLRRDAEQQRYGSSSAAMVSPPFSFSRPPLYSHHSSGNSAGLISPPESRRTSSEEHIPNGHASNAQGRLSLPSIHEALGQNTPLNYPGPPPPPPASLPPASPLRFSHNSSATTSADPRRMSFGSSEAPPPPPPSSQPAQRSPYMGHHAPPTPTRSAPMQQQSSHSRPEPLPATALFAPQIPKLPSLNLRAGNSPPPSNERSSFSYPSQQSPTPYDNSPHSAPSNGSFGGYSDYQSQHPYHSAASNGQGYPAPAVSSAISRYTPSWRSDADQRTVEERRQAGRVVVPAHGEHVKRHLEQFDYEASLNAMAECTGRVLEFTRTCGQRAHQAHRSGPVEGSMPTLQELEDLAPKLQKLHETFAHLREMVLSSNVALVEQQKEPALSTSSYGGDQSSYIEEPKNGSGGFAGSDSKKRRGRAAPPGRCHSCNRAETPEWRRGPDGARTLCNACGLHYAKLTRKMGISKTPLQNTSLRPKSVGSRSPIL